jgi:Xaa-Pro aminopeptidase
MGLNTANVVLAASSLDEISTRVARLRKEMEKAGIDVFYVGHSTDLEYMAGIERPIATYGRTRFWASWAFGAIYGRHGSVPLIVSRHFAGGHLNEGGAPIQGVDLKIVNEDDDVEGVVSALIRERAAGEPRRIAVNLDASAELVLNLRRAFPKAEVFIAADTLARLRYVKSAAELDAISAACDIADRVFTESLEVLSPKMTERGLARWIDDRMGELGAIAPSFHTGIWTMGPAEKREARERLSRREIGTNTTVNYDFGAGLKGYCSDFGRTVHMGRPSARYREAYALVLASQEAGRKALRPGASARDVNALAHKVIDDGGFGEFFWHRLGHAIGKDTHEAPFLEVVDDTPLEEGMTFTIEPSIFIPGELGCRVEDVYVVTAAGGRRLNAVDSELRSV